MSISKWLFGNKNDNVKENESTETNDLKITKFNIEYEAICPYCNTLLKKMPIRKTKCPHCKNSIVVRKSNDSKIKTLVTEEQAEAIEIEEKEVFFRKRWLAEIVDYGGTEDDFYKRKEEYFLKSGIENNDKDVLWSMFNELLITNTKDINLLGRIYYSMAIFLHQEGKDNFKLLQLNAKTVLDRFQLCGFEFNVEILGSSDSCDTCKIMNGKIISIEEAYLLPIPCTECTHRIGFCRCFFGLVAIRDKDGMLIPKQ